jgi:hypothetical protein
MVLDPQLTTKLAELKKQLEGIAGREVDLSVAQLRLGIFPLAASTYLADHDADNDAWVTYERIIFPQPFARTVDCLTRADVRPQAPMESSSSVSAISYVVETELLNFQNRLISSQPHRQ